MNHYPVFLDLRGQTCLIVGGGRVAERKAQPLLDAGAAITVVSPALVAELQKLVASGAIRHHAKSFDESDLDGAFLVIAATDAVEINRNVGRLCRQRGILVNVAAPPEESSFIVPSTVRRGSLSIAISTGGISPALSKKIRLSLEETFGPEYEPVLEKMGALRKRLMSEIDDESVRRKVITAVVESDVIDLYRAGKDEEAERRVREITGSALP